MWRKPGICWVPLITHTHHRSKEQRGTDTSTSTSWRGLRMDVLQNAEIHTIPNSAQEVKKDTGVQPQQVSRFTLSPWNLAGRDSWRDETLQTWWSDDGKWNTWPSWSQDTWRETQSESHSNFFSCSLRTASATKDGNLPVTDGCVNNTLSTTAHFQRLRTAAHPVRISLHGSRLSFRLKTNTGKVSFCP